MSDGSSQDKETSLLILVSYQELHELLSTPTSETSNKHIENVLQARLPQLRRCTDPFGKPSPQSKKSLESGQVKLADGSLTNVSDEEKQESLAISARFQLDEIEALVLLRSCFAHVDPSSLTSGSNGNATYDAELEGAIEEYYFEQRLHILRVFLPLLAASGDAQHMFHVPASDAKQSIMPDAETFALDLINELERRARQTLPASVVSDPATASRWARQATREQLCLLEVLFAIFWELNPCPPNIVVRVFEVLFSTNLGRLQVNSNYLMDEEGCQLLSDLESFWVLVGLQILALDSVTGEKTMNEGLLGDPTALRTLHELIITSFRLQPQHGPLLMAWSVLLSHLTTSRETEATPSSFTELFEIIVPPAPAVPFYQQCAEIALSPDIGLFAYISQLLASPILSSATAAKKNSAVTTPNALPYRLTIHDLVIGMAETLQIGYITDIDAFIAVVETLFGSGERSVVTPLCHKFWTEDWTQSVKRQQLLQVAALRFPVEPRPLVRLLRALSGSGDDATSGTSANPAREVCVRHVYHYLAHMSGFAHIIRSADLQSSAYDVRSDMVLNVRAIQLPGGTTLPARSSGQTLSMRSPGAPLAVRWSHSYSGWRVLLDILLEYVRDSRSQGPDHAVARLGHLSLVDIGMESDDPRSLVCDILALFRCVAEGNMAFAKLLMDNLSDDSDESSELAAPDLVQVAQIVLEDCLSHAVPGSVNLATNALGILMSLLPVYPGRVWPYLRSTHLLFSTPLFAAERALGQYTMTCAVVDLVGALRTEARVMALRHSSQRVLQHMKSDVLLKGLTFVHNEVWLAYSNWRYIRLSDRFDIGHKVAELYCAILEGPEGPTGDSADDMFEPLTSFLLKSFLHSATVPCVTPLVSAISSGHELMRSLNQAHRFAEANSLAQLLKAHVRLAELVLARKSPDTGISLLEQTLFTSHKKRSAIDAIAALVEDKFIPLEAVRLLSTLASTPVSMVSHLSSPQRVVDALLRIVRHPHEEIRLRIDVWKFISRCVAHQPVLAKLFISGEFKAPRNSTSAPGEGSASGTSSPGYISVIALETVNNWGLLRELNPELLAAVLELLDSIWQRALEHTEVLDSARADTQFWTDLVALATDDLDLPDADATVQAITINDYSIESDLHEIPDICYRTVAKAYAVHILALDIALAPKKDGKPSTDALPSLTAFEKGCKDMQKLIYRAVSRGHASNSIGAVREFVDENIPGLHLDAFRFPSSASRKFGDNYLLDLLKVKESVWHYSQNDVEREDWNRALLIRLCQLNVEWSLADSQIALTRSWVHLLTSAGSWLRSKSSMRPTLLECASAVAELTGDDKQLGDVMPSVHAERINVLLALAEALGLSKLADGELVNQFVDFCEDLQRTIVNPRFPPLESLRETPGEGFHRSLLQVVYFTAQHARQLLGSGSKLTAVQRQKIVSAITVSLDLAVDGLRTIFDAARSALDLGLDSDMQLLVLTLGQLVRPELFPSSSTWLARCQHSDIIRASLELFVRLDLTGQAHPDHYRSNHQALYARSIFDLHLILASYGNSAERLAHENVILAYSANQLSPALEAGVVDVLHIDLPGERSPAHRTWCRMLSTTTALVGHLSYNSHFVDLDVTSFVQLYRRQIMRTLEWSVNEPLTAPLVEEMLHVAELFHAVARGAGADNTLGREFVRVGHRLLQHIGYALAHPNHLLGLLEPLTADERVLLEADEAATGEVGAGIIDPTKKPVLARVGMALFRVARIVLSAVMLFVKADDVIVKLDEAEWDSSWEKLQPTVTVSIEDSASVGTMIELGRTAIDVLRYLGSLKTPPAPSQGLTTPLLTLPKFELKAAQSEVQMTLELVVAYSTSQVALWLRDEEGERWEREIKGTVAEDVQALLGRAVSVVGGREAEAAGVFEVLAGFLEGKLSE